MMRAQLKVTDYDADVRPTAADLGRYCATLSPVLTAELEGAALATGLTCKDILLAALGRTICRAVGDGFAAVDVVCTGTGTAPITLACVGPDRLPAADLLAAVHSALAAASRSPRTQPEPQSTGRADVLFSFDQPTPARLGHFLELHARAAGDGLLLEWWYDVRSFEPYTIVELAEQFPYAMIELTAEAVPFTVATPALAAAY